MAEMTFGRSIRYRRTKLGLSQTRLGELVGRSAAAVRSWEKEASTPSDPSVLQALSAVLGIEQAVLFEKAGVDAPFLETSPTVEEVLGSLAPEKPVEDLLSGDVERGDDGSEDEGADESEPMEEFQLEEAPVLETAEDSSIASVAEELVSAEPSSKTPQPIVGFIDPSPQHYVYTMPAPPVVEQTYMEDVSQRQIYRIRNLATLVLGVFFIVLFIWALSNGWNELTSWWDDFVGNLQL